MSSVADRFTMRCPACRGKNSKSAGGNVTCFHCESCDFVECEWCAPVQPDWDKVVSSKAAAFAAPAAPSERDLRNILTRLIEFLARPYQEGGRGMADSADSELSKLLRECRAGLSSQEGE